MRRLLLALDAQDRPQPQIEAAALLAAALGARLEVLLLEDEKLHAAAALPIMQEISSASARTRELSTVALEQALRAISKTAESGFRAVAGDGEGRFRVRRGPRDVALEEAAAEVDLLLLPGRRGVLRFRVLPAPGVCAICSDSPAGRRTLELATRLARQTDRPLTLVHTGSPALLDAPSGRRQDFPAGTALEQLLSAADTGQGNILLVSRDVATAGGKGPAEQLASLRCEVLVVG
jgi:nucleotide-binding universal stress UspA family protein